jgi:carboxymethylenebutenolidase
MQTEMLTIDGPDGAMKLYRAAPDGEATAAVVVIQEAFGLNEHIQDVTRRFADLGYVAVAPELFHRAGGGTAPYDDFSQVLPLYDGLDGDAPLLVDVDAALGRLHDEGFADEHIGIVGFCFGGRVSMLAALNRPLGAGVGFYGGGIVTARFAQFPTLLDQVPSLTVPWLGLYGDQDKGIPIEDVEALRAALSEAPAPGEIVRYTEAGHGFHCDVRADYRPDAAADAWARTSAWFARHLTGSVDPA